MITVSYQKNGPEVCSERTVSEVNYFKWNQHGGGHRAPLTDSR